GARGLARKRASRPKQGGDQQAARPQGLPDRRQAEQARQLAREQRELRRAVEEAARQAARPGEAPRQSPVGELARQQEEVARQAGEPARNVGKEQGQQDPTTRQAAQSAQAGRDATGRAAA